MGGGLTGGATGGVTGGVTGGAGTEVIMGSCSCRGGRRGRPWRCRGKRHAWTRGKWPGYKAG
ncbi:MAG: hypothetical protein C0477_22155 [Delftia sp.]|nr:hypothetical protein [Delftia sp.]